MINIKNTKKDNYPKPDIEDCSSVSSSTECTGLIQGNNISNEKAEDESFEEIYDIPKQQHKSDK